ANLMGSSCSFTAEFIQCISEANYLRGVANVKGVKGFGPDRGGKEKYAKPNPGIGFPGALELITQNCIMLSVETNSHNPSFDGMETRLEERS
ncbi:hypothetical protein H0E87_009628, partial [Populus deltoides]